LQQNNYNLQKYSLPAITNTNTKKLHHKPQLTLTKKHNQAIISPHLSQYIITNQHISFKHLHFKFTKQLIQKHNLYPNIPSPTILIKIKNPPNYTFQLHKKLQQNPIPHLIHPTNIHNIQL
ncbi:exotoxin beta-grasp domain-containing protein, partial [Staphylococcus aureus]|uniref:exotoxin beta-grasp domain-containing protein n=1 Tax=Staphylococcus aureus TaxID=1280 RepID=UPI0037DA49B2